MDLLLTVDGDLPDRNTLVSGAIDVRQRIELRLKRHLGEWFLDTGAGLPFEDWAQQKPPDIPAIVARIRTEVAAVRGVRLTQRFEGSFDGDTRSLTINGEFLLDEEIAPETLTLFAAPESGNAAYFGVYFGSARPVGSPPHVGAYYDFGVF